MNYPEKFNDIRCYNDEELRQVLKGILDQPVISNIMTKVLGVDYAEYFLRSLAPMNTITDFQREVIIVLLTVLEKKTCQEVELLGTNNIDTERGHFYISNHRDIILDSAFLNSHLFYKGFNTTQIAIGNNLLITPWIEHVVRMNKSFIVRRNGSIKEQLLISRTLSEYMRYVITERKESIWIAQREGRSKDSSDNTQPAIIKMINMAGGNNMVENISELNITPVSINYEYVPCDYLQAKEFQLKRDNPNYKKQPADDLKNMETGLMGYKGNVSYVINKPLDIPYSIVKMPRQEQAEGIAKLIDKSIHANYKLYANNYIAADLLSGGGEYRNYYTSSEVAKFVRYVETQIAKIDIENPDNTYLRTMMYKIYANPAINQTAALK